jgi:hypothetical protein
LVQRIFPFGPAVGVRIHAQPCAVYVLERGFAVRTQNRVQVVRLIVVLRQVPGPVAVEIDAVICAFVCSVSDVSSGVGRSVDWNLPNAFNGRHS